MEGLRCGIVDVEGSQYSLDEICGGIVDVEDSQNSLRIDSLARFAVEDYNRKQILSSALMICFGVDLMNGLLEFGKVVSAKVQVVAGAMYYITLEATKGGKKKVYEAIIWEQPWLNFKEVQEFKPVGDALCTTSRWRQLMEGIKRFMKPKFGRSHG